MRTLRTPASRASFTAPLALVAALAACGDTTPAADAGARATVPVPTIVGSVAREDFCRRYAEIYCAANQGCCQRPEARAQSRDACLTTAPCPLLQDEGAGAGYDAQAAGDFLRAQAGAASRCALASGGAGFVVGSGASGAACALNEARVQCAAGLACAPAAGAGPNASPQGVCAAVVAPAALGALGARCDDSGGCASGRCAGHACAARRADGEACADDEDCASERCAGGACGASGEAYCAAPPEAPPANTDWSNPTQLCLAAHGTSSDNGTGANITLAFLYDRFWYYCSLAGGVRAGAERCCTPARGSGTFRTSESSNGDMYIQMDNGDGLRFTSLQVVKGSASQRRSTYRDSSKVSCVGCTAGYDCESCWVDSDGHDDCAVVRVPMSGSAVTWCSNELRSADFVSSN